MDADLQKRAASCSELEGIEKLTAFEGERYLLSPDKDISEAQISQVAWKISSAKSQIARRIGLGARTALLNTRSLPLSKKYIATLTLVCLVLDGFTGIGMEGGPTASITHPWKKALSLKRADAIYPASFEFDAPGSSSKPP